MPLNVKDAASVLTGHGNVVTELSFNYATFSSYQILLSDQNLTHFQISCSQNPSE